MDPDPVGSVGSCSSRKASLLFIHRLAANRRWLLVSFVHAKQSEGETAMPEPTLWQASFLARFSPRVQQKMLSLAESFTFAPGETIFREGDPSLCLYLMKSGRVAIEVHIPARGARTVLTVGPGELFSWSALVEPRVETASARALEQTEVLRIKGGTLMDVGQEDPEFGLELYRTLAEVISARLVATRLQLLDEIGWPAEPRSG